MKDEVALAKNFRIGDIVDNQVFGRMEVKEVLIDRLIATDGHDLTPSYCTLVDRPYFVHLPGNGVNLVLLLCI